MSVITVGPGDRIELDPNDIKTVVWDWDTFNLATGAGITTPTFTIAVIRQQGPTALTKDNEGIVTGTNSRKSSCRLIATTATLGDEYEIEGRILTNESPTQTKNYSIYVGIANK